MMRPKGTVNESSNVVMVEIDAVLGVFLFVVMAGTGVLLIWMARAAASGRLKRNAIAGIRVASTMASDEAWQAAHIRAKRPTILSGWASIASGVLALLPVSAPFRAATVLAGCVFILGFLLYGSKVGSRAATEIANKSRAGTAAQPTSGPPSFQ